MANKQSTLTKVNILKKATLDAIDLSKHVGEIFATTDEPENEYTTEDKTKLSEISLLANGFAETERQKSKNLFDKNNATIYDAYIDIYNNAFIYDSVAKSVVLEIKPNTTYTVSKIASARFAIGTSVLNPNTDVDGIPYVAGGDATTHLTITSGAHDKYLLIFCYHTTEDTVSLQTILDSLQVEYGAVATDYQPYGGGPITHNGDKPVVFAESERQKSKNLWTYGDITGTIYKDVKLENPLPAGTTYTMSGVVTSSDTTWDVSLIALYSGDYGLMLESRQERNTRFELTFTLDRPCTNIYFYASGNYSESVGDTFSYTDIMITTDGSTDYQPYNGAITHNNDAPVAFAEAERIKTLNLCNNEMFEWGDIVSQGKVEQASNTIIRTKNYISVKPGSKYFIGLGLNSGSIGLKYYSDKSLSSATTTNEYLTSGVITVPNGSYYLRICSKLSDVSVDITKQQLYLYEGTTDYGYLEYNGAIVHEKDVADVEHVETIYDSSSSDSNINWGYSNGLKGGTTIENVNFSKYKKVKIYCAWFNAVLQPIVIDFSVVSTSSIVGNAIYKNNNETHSISCTIQDKNKFTVNECYSYNSGTPVLENEDYFVVKKIEGVY